MQSKEFVEFIHNEKFERVWSLIADAMQQYFRVEIEGLENIPESGAAIIAPNHSGFAGYDAIVLSHIIHDAMKRQPRILAHRFYFEFSRLERMVANSFGLRLASTRRGINILKSQNLLMIFPEGEKGNFKSTLRRYQLQTYHSGFVRMALSTNSPIIPAIVIGAEESNLNWGSLDLGYFSRSLRIPIPVNLFPLPAKWKVKFLEPIYLDKVSEDCATDKYYLEEIAERIRQRMQKQIDYELEKREFVFFPVEKKVRDVVKSVWTSKYRSALPLLGGSSKDERDAEPK